MFQHLNAITNDEESNVLVAFYHDVRDALEAGESTAEVCMVYTEKYPEYKDTIENQYMQDILDGMPNDADIADEVMTADNAALIQEVQDEIDALASPAGTIIMQINNRFKVLEKVDANRQCGLDIETPSW